MRYRLNFFCSICILLFLAACSNNKNLSRYNYSYLYQEDQHLIKPHVKFFHSSEDTTELYFTLNSNDILYGKLGNDSISIARVLCRYYVYGTKGEKDIIDSATVPFISYGENANSKLLQAHVKMAIPIGKLYPVEIRFRDEYRDLNVVYNYWADKRKNGNAQYFLLMDGKKIITNQQVEQNKPYTLRKSKLIIPTQFQLNSSKQLFEMTPPPFATNVALPTYAEKDTTYNITFSKDLLRLTFSKPIQWLSCELDTNIRPFYFFSFNPNFPKISRFDDMIGPIRYISTSAEYKSLNQAINKKKALDHFWLNLGKQEDRTKKMIREFYRRVELANQYFSDFREGWKTDRGIILIVYGEPTNIYKTINQETWIYGEENHILSIKFDFILRDHTMSRNVYELKRDTDYKNNWYRAVDNWRQAKNY